MIIYELTSELSTTKNEIRWQILFCFHTVSVLLSKLILDADFTSESRPLPQRKRHYVCKCRLNKTILKVSDIRVWMKVRILFRFWIQYCYSSIHKYQCFTVHWNWLVILWHPQNILPWIFMELLYVPRVVPRKSMGFHWTSKVPGELAPTLKPWNSTEFDKMKMSSRYQIKGRNLDGKNSMEDWCHLFCWRIISMKFREIRISPFHVTVGLIEFHVIFRGIPCSFTVFKNQ